jgi:formylglycine-generating enzyme required for sulfatase activity
MSFYRFGVCHLVIPFCMLVLLIGINTACFADEVNSTHKLIYGEWIGSIRLNKNMIRGLPKFKDRPQDADVAITVLSETMSRFSYRLTVHKDMTFSEVEEVSGEKKTESVISGILELVGMDSGNLRLRVKTTKPEIKHANFQLRVVNENTLATEFPISKLPDYSDEQPLIFEVTYLRKGTVAADSELAGQLAKIERHSMRNLTNCGIRFLGCPAGSFNQASGQDAQNGRVTDEKADLQQVKAFWISETEITRTVWQKVMQNKPWESSSERLTGVDDAMLPVTFVSWNDATKFCEVLTSRERAAGRLPANWSYQLPTEVEWEYACRGASTTEYSFGNEAAKLSTYAWWGAYDDGSASEERHVHQVGMKKPNPWGLRDMHGNVCEWCRDEQSNDAGLGKETYSGEEFFDKLQYVPGAGDPTAVLGIGKGAAVVEYADKSFGTARWCRGGAWTDSWDRLKSGERDWHFASAAANHIGFRVVLTEVASQR